MSISPELSAEASAQPASPEMLQKVCQDVQTFVREHSQMPTYLWEAPHIAFGDEAPRPLLPRDARNPHWYVAVNGKKIRTVAPAAAETLGVGAEVIFSDTIPTYSYMGAELPTELRKVGPKNVYDNWWDGATRCEVQQRPGLEYEEVAYQFPVSGEVHKETEPPMRAYQPSQFDKKRVVSVGECQAIQEVVTRLHTMDAAELSTVIRCFTEGH